MAQAEFGILYFLQTLHTPWLDVIMKNITLLGDKGIFWVFLGAALLCFPRTRRIGFAVLLTLAMGFLVGNVFLKTLVARERPCWIDPTVKLLVAMPKDFSFPSGHSLASFGAAVSIFLYNRRWGAGALVLAALIAFSRLYLFVHFPTDVLAGIILGAVLALVAHRIVEWAIKRSKARRGRSEPD